MPSALSKKEVDAIAIWEPHAQNASDILGGDALVLEDASVYRERFNLNTTTRVLDNSAKRRALVGLVRAVARVSRQLEESSSRFLPAIPKAISTPEPVIAKVWGQFRFPAALDQRGLVSTLRAIEPWAAEIARRQPRTTATLAPLVEGSIVAEARN